MIWPPCILLSPLAEMRQRLKKRRETKANPCSCTCTYVQMYVLVRPHHSHIAYLTLLACPCGRHRSQPGLHQDARTRTGSMRLEACRMERNIGLVEKMCLTRKVRCKSNPSLDVGCCKQIFDFFVFSVVATLAQASIFQIIRLLFYDCQQEEFPW